jgi:hypothetical protein
MMRMPAPLRSFAFAVIVTWVLLSIAGVAYAQQKSIAAPVAAAVIFAFLVEAVFYLAPGSASLRDEIGRRLPPARLVGLLVVSAAIPYCAYSAPLGLFRWSSLGVLLLLAALVSFWYVWLPRGPAADIAFLVLISGIVLERRFRAVYLTPEPRLHLEILGQLMWIRLGVSAVLMLRRMEGVGFGFLPSRREWWIGAAHYLCFAPLGVGLALASGFARFRPPPASWWELAPIAAATFLGMLWVVALGEEFFFRGLLQQWLGEWLRSPIAGWLMASALFGLAHLPFRSFPNWRFAAIATLAGLFYGRAYRKAGSIRAAMVTHALVNTTWRVFLT